MSKFTDFYEALLQNEEAKKQVLDILGEKALSQADDQELEAISSIAGQLGYEISGEEARKYFQDEEKELDEDELDAVAGGKRGEVRVHYIYCEIGGSAEQG